MSSPCPYTTLISTEALATHLDDPTWVLVDCRFDLQKPYWANLAYQTSHIPGAVFADLDRSLSGTRTLQTGRHPLPDPAEFAEKLSGWGIGPETQVVAYDTTGGSYAARLWWMLRWLGHPQVAVLDGGFPKWEREGRPTRGGLETRPRGQFVPRVQPEMLVSAEQVEQVRQDPAYRLIDARAPVRFRGEQEPIDTVAGHIPGAVNRFHGDNLAENGTLLPAETLRRQFEQLLAGLPPEQAVVYCGSGVTSCHHLLAMEIAGLPGARLYPGSWSEWIRDPSRPIATGES